MEMEMEQPEQHTADGTCCFKLVVLRPMARVLQLVQWCKLSGTCTAVDELAPAPASGQSIHLRIDALDEDDDELLKYTDAAHERARHWIDCMFIMPTNFVIVCGERVLGRVGVFRSHSIRARAPPQPPMPLIASSCETGTAWKWNALECSHVTDRPQWETFLRNNCNFRDNYIDSFVPHAFSQSSLEQLFEDAEEEEEEDDATILLTSDDDAEMLLQQQQQQQRASATHALLPHTAALVARGAVAEGLTCALAHQDLASASTFFVPPCAHVVIAGDAEWDSRIPALSKCPSCREHTEGCWVRVTLPPLCLPLPLPLPSLELALDLPSVA